MTVRVAQAKLNLTTPMEETSDEVATKTVYSANPLAEQVYQLLKQDIFNFRLFPGDR